MRVDIFGPIEARTHENAHIVHHAKLDRAHLHHLGAERGELQHFLECDLFKPVGVTARRADRWYRRHRRRCRCRSGRRGWRPPPPPPRFGAAAAERGDARRSLCRPWNPAMTATSLRSPKRWMISAPLTSRCGPRHARSRSGSELPALPGARVDIHVLQRDGEQAGGDLFAGRDHGVVFPGIEQ